VTHTAESLQKAFKYLFPNEVPALKELARMLPPNPVIINIGAGAGTSGLAFMESREDLILYTIDIQKDDSPLGCLVAERAMLENAGLLDWTRYGPLQGNSKDWGENWQHITYVNGKSAGYPLVDLVFIDGDHSYDGCKNDIMAWLPNIKPDGIIAIHDYCKQDLFTDDYNEDKPHPDYPHPKPWPGVDKAVDELLLGKYEQVMRVDSLIAFLV